MVKQILLEKQILILPVCQAFACSGKHKKIIYTVRQLYEDERMAEVNVSVVRMSSRPVAIRVRVKYELWRIYYTKEIFYLEDS